MKNGLLLKSGITVSRAGWLSSRLMKRKSALSADSNNDIRAHGVNQHQ
jgi:hypothetical protein